jgi:hypothetical protein
MTAFPERITQAEWRIIIYVRRFTIAGANNE